MKQRTVMWCAVTLLCAASIYVLITRRKSAPGFPLPSAAHLPPPPAIDLPPTLASDLPPAPVAKAKSRSPRLLPLTIALSVVLWIIVATGGRHVFIREVLGEAFDSQAEHLLRRDSGVDAAAIQNETIIVKGRTFMYFGPFPAFVRIPLHFIYPAGRGAWSRISGFCAGVIALAAFAGLIRRGLSSSKLSTRWRNLVGNACLLAFVFGSPLLLLIGNLSIYHEAIIWGFAWSFAAVYYAYRSRTAEGPKLTRSLLFFSLCGGAALLSRVTFGAPFLLIAPVLALPLLRKDRRIRNLAALFLPLGAAFLFYVAFNYAKFGNPTGPDLKGYVNWTQRDFAEKHGVFDLRRVPYSFADYFYLRRPEPQPKAPFVITRQAAYDHPDLYVMPFTQTYSSLLWCSPWALLGALGGILLLLWPKSSDGVYLGIAVGLFAEVIVILAFMGLAQRYTAEFFPFLVFCFVLFLQKGGTALLRLRYALIGLIVISVVINSLTTTSWHSNDPYTPLETRTFWNRLIGRPPP
jgi:hypothetical protein